MRFRNTAHALVREVFFCITFVAGRLGDLERENGCLKFLSRTWTPNLHITRTFQTFLRFSWLKMV